MKKINKKNSNKVFLMSFVFMSVCTLVNAADGKGFINTEPQAQPQAPPQRAPGSTGVEPAVPDIGTSKTAPGVPPAPVVAPATSNGSTAVTNDVNGVVESMVKNKDNTSQVRIKDGSGQVREVTVNEKTSVFMNNKKIRLSTVKVGDQVKFKQNTR